MKMSLEYLHKQCKYFKKGLEWKAWVPAPTTDILEVTTDTKQSGNWKDFDLQQSSASANSFFSRHWRPKIQSKKLTYAGIASFILKKQTQTHQTKTPK